MQNRIRAAGSRDRAPEHDGALVRLVVDSERWAEDVPPVPEGHAVTVAFSTEDLAAEHAEAIELLGYWVVGAHEDWGEPDAADFLVSEALIESHPAWWRALARLAAHVYVLRLGPVRAALAHALRVHSRL
ncbi:MAG: hypothetical protein ACRD0K_02715 [Egibacteraceae bacterium]